MTRFRAFAVLLCGLFFSLLAAPLARPSLESNLDPNASPPIKTSAEQPSPVVPVRDLLGSSGNLRAVIATTDSLSRHPALQSLLPQVPLGTPGVHSLGLSEPGGDSLVAVALEPLDALRDTRLRRYRVGAWPTGGRAAKDPRYAPPAGFIAVTRENASTQVSKRFHLRDFLTHDQQDVWPKVLVLRPALLDKLELIGEELEGRGLPSSLHVMSGFRTPQYNAKGVGAKGGRASASRHMYGDAADVFVDANRDGVMDDLDGDGRTTIRDARVLYAVAELVESRNPGLVGGLSAYPANAAHGPFVHVDVRGSHARW